MHHKNLSNLAWGKDNENPKTGSSCTRSRLHAQGVIGLLVDEVNPLVSVMKVDKARLEHGKNTSLT